MPLTLKNFYKQGWQPGPNTIAYFPLDTDFKNAVTGTALTAYNGATIGTLGTVSCLNLTAGNSCLSGTISTLPQGGQARTNMFWVKWNSRGRYPVYGYGSSGNGRGDTVFNNNNISWSQYGYSLVSDVYEDVSNWIHVAVTTSGNSAVLYVNGVIQKSGSLTINTNGTTLYLGKNDWDGAYLNGYISQFIIEDRTRTAQEVADYFNQTKSLYGIS